jgi:hypothetical protein
MEQLASIMGIDIDRTPHILLRMEKGLNSVLIDQLYFSGSHPENYRDYKKRIVDADNMRKRQEANKRRHQHHQCPGLGMSMIWTSTKTGPVTKRTNATDVVKLDTWQETPQRKKNSRIFEIGLYCGLYTP